MSKLLIAVLLLSTVAHAESWETTNQNGGKIVLTDTKCTSEPSKMVVFSQANNGPTLFGCWFYAEGYAMVKWSDGDIRAYPENLFAKKQK